MAIAGIARILAASRSGLILCLILGLSEGAAAQTLYKYRGENGEWIYTDRKPAATENVETRALRPSFEAPEFKLRHRISGQSVEFIADNDFHAPVEVVLEFQSIIGVDYPHPDDDLNWVVAPRSEESVLTLALNSSASAPFVEYRYSYLVGDPGAVPDTGYLYRVPFAASVTFPVTQAYPDKVTHLTPDSFHAVDVAMPIGTDILAARDGVVFDVAAQNFRGGIDAIQNGGDANVVRILHDDGTFSVYAHLNWNSIRVRPGERVVAGQYIADSGNTGFSTGPHLHFAVQRNSGMQIVSLPVAFRASGAAAVVPRTGDDLAGR